MPPTRFKIEEQNLLPLHLYLISLSHTLPRTTFKSNRTMTRTILSSIFVAALIGYCSAFAPLQSSVRKTSLSMAPRFDKTSEKWITDVPEEMEGSSYGPIGTLYRAGPKPFFTRIFNPDTYDQGE